MSKGHRYDGYPLSFGGGVNSVALAVLLVAEGWREPIVYAETGSEWPETDAYVAMFDGWLQERGLSITRLGPEWRPASYQVPLIDYCEHYGIVPGSFQRWCTTRFKVEPITRWCEANGYDYDDQLLGIASDESRRQPERVRPLVDRGIDRNGCARIIADAGLPLPPKSACWLCPFQGAAEWRYLYQTHRDLYERAAALERATTERRGRRTVLMANGQQTLDEFAAGIEAQTTWLEFTDYYSPCLCRI